MDSVPHKTIPNSSNITFIKFAELLLILPVESGVGSETSGRKKIFMNIFFNYFSRISVLQETFCKRDKERSKSTLKLQKALKQLRWNKFINTRSMILNGRIQVSKKEVNKVSAVCTILDKRFFLSMSWLFCYVYTQSSYLPQTKKKNELGFVNYSCHFPINLQYYSRQ